MSDNISILLKGAPGSGKTEAALTFPGPINLQYADANKVTVLQAKKRRPDIEWNRITTWVEFKRFVDEVRRGKVDAGTIAVDTMDFLIRRKMWVELQGPRDKLTIPMFGVGLNRQMEAFYDLTEASDKHNIVATCHTLDITTGEDGALEKVGLNLMGAFKDSAEALFDYVFLCEGGVKTKVVDGKAVKTKVWKYYTVSPNRYHTCKGGRGLPPIIEVEENQNFYEIFKAYLDKAV